MRNNNGYLSVTLSKNGKTKMFLVHRLVANAFIQNPLNLPVINHRDENPLNNHVDNLEFCTQKYNSNYGSCQKRRVAKLKGKFVNGPLAKQVLQFDEDGNLVKTWPSAHEVERQLGFTVSNICSCCRGKRESAYGFVWRY